MIGISLFIHGFVPTAKPSAGHRSAQKFCSGFSDQQNFVSEYDLKMFSCTFCKRWQILFAVRAQPDSVLPGSRRLMPGYRLRAFAAHQELKIPAYPAMTLCCGCVHRTRTPPGKKMLLI